MRQMVNVFGIRDILIQQDDHFLSAEQSKNTEEMPPALFISGWLVLNSFLFFHVFHCLQSRNPIHFARSLLGLLKILSVLNRTEAKQFL